MDDSLNANKLAARLDAARREGRELAPLTDELKLGPGQGYAIQDALLRLELEHGGRLVGRKLGLTSEAKQRSIGIATPIHGFLVERMLHAASEPILLAHLIHPRIEPEIAFRLAADLEGSPTVEEVIAATSEVVPALEVIDSRYRDFRFTLPDVLADNTSAALVVVGEEGLPPADIDLELEEVSLSVNGEVIATATGAAVLGHPARAIAWLASERPLRRGDLVLSGGLTEAVRLAAGQEIVAEYARLGTLRVNVE